MVKQPKCAEFKLKRRQVNDSSQSNQENDHLVSQVYDAHPRRTHPWVTHKNNTMCSPVILKFFKVLLDFLLIGVQIGAIYFPTSQEHGTLTYKKCTSNT
jgi:hypothetical protein